MAKTDVKLHSKSKRTFTGHVMVGDVKKNWEFKPGETKFFDAETAERLLRLYPDEVQSLDTIKNQFDEIVAENFVEADAKEETKKDKLALSK